MAERRDTREGYVAGGVVAPAEPGWQEGQTQV